MVLLKKAEFRAAVPGKHVGGSKHSPVWEFRQGASPFGQPGFAAIDFLATSDKCHNQRPVFMPIHYFKHHFGF
jgi:hypothetical protein